MVEIDDDAPTFTAPMADGDVETFTLSDHLDETPLVLAFFPAAYTSVCTSEMCSFRDQLANFEDVGASVYGISADLPFALNAFRDDNELNFPLLSDPEREVIEAYDVVMSFDQYAVPRVAKRSVFVVDSEGTITYKWVSDDPGVEPDYDEIEAAVEEAA